MKRIVLFLAIFVLSGLPSPNAFADEKPISILSAKIGGHVHPSICRTNNGVLVVVYQGANVLMFARSKDDGKTWSKPQPLATSAKRPDSIRK